MSRPELSIVIPVFNEEAVIGELERRLNAFLSGMGVTWEVVFVNDGSSDKSADMLAELCQRDPRYKLVSFSRNFGHQLAITAGLDYAIGDAVVMMDADLQDPPEVVAEMLARFRDGYDVVYGVRIRRSGETWLKRLTAASFYRLFRMMVGVNIPLDAGDFRLISRRVMITLSALRETHRFVRGMVSWVGFKQIAVYYERPERFAGETHYPYRKMFRLAFDGMTAFSSVPLRFATWLGTASSVVGIGVALWVIYARLFLTGSVAGWATIMIAVCLGSGAQLLMIGILGEYVGRIYDEVKRRPLYLVEREVNTTRRRDGDA